MHHRIPAKRKKKKVSNASLAILVCALAQLTLKVRSRQAPEENWSVFAETDRLAAEKKKRKMEVLHRNPVHRLCWSRPFGLLVTPLSLVFL